MAMIVEFKANIMDNRIRLHDDLDYETKKFNSDSEKYILNSFNKMLNNPIFKVRPDIASDIFNLSYRKIIKDVQDKASEMFSEVLNDVHNRITDILNRYETMTYRDIESEIYNAKLNINNIISFDNINKIDDIMDKEIDKSIREYMGYAKINQNDREIHDIKATFKDDIKNNIEKIKRDFVNKSQNQIINFYEDAKLKMRENKLNEIGQEELEQQSISEKDEFTTSVLESEKEHKKGVSVSELGNSFLDFEVIQKYMAVFDPEMELKVEDNCLVATNASGMPYSIEKKDDVISFSGRGDDSERLGLKINEQDQTLTVKKYLEEEMIVFDTNKNNITLTCPIDGKTTSYELNFDQGNIIAFEVVGDSKNPVENTDVLLEKIKSSNINIDSVLQISKDLSMGNEQRS